MTVHITTFYQLEPSLDGFLQLSEKQLADLWNEAGHVLVKLTPVEAFRMRTLSNLIMARMLELARRRFHHEV